MSDGEDFQRKYVKGGELNFPDSWFGYDRKLTERDELIIEVMNADCFFGKHWLPNGEPFDTAYRSFCPCAPEEPEGFF